MIEHQQQDLESFARSLDDFSTGLTMREMEALELLIYRAMTPLERLRLRASAGLLTRDEEELWQSIEPQEAPG